MTEAVIVDAIRTPLGRRGGALAHRHPAELLGDVLRGMIDRTGIDPARVDDHIAGCVSQAGEQSANIGRTAWLLAGLPESVPSVTIDRQCGSSQQAIHFAAQGVIAGAYDVVVASGVESMTRVPLGSAMVAGPGDPFPPSLHARYGGLVHQGISAELIAARWGIDREACDAFGLRSQLLARVARDQGRFEREIQPVLGGPNGEGTLITGDEGIRETSAEILATLKPAFYDEPAARRYPEIQWVVTAGSASQITDGASAVMIMASHRAEELGLSPRAKFKSFAVAGDDPIYMLTATIPATERALAVANLALTDIDVVEINEAFSPVVLAWKQQLEADDDWFEASVNVNGGAIALGHPVGASGARLMTTLLHELERSQGRYGLQTMCEGGGLANATIIERV